MAHDLQKKWRSDDVKLKENADFSSLLLSERVLSGLTNAGFRRPSPIQFEAIPIGRYGIDLLVQAKSGTGKTLVFTVLALEKLQHKLHRPQVLIIAPTREIAAQICCVMKTVGSSFPKLTCYSFIGGLSVEEDKAKAYTCQIVVGTPGRLKQLIQLGSLPTNSIRLFVLDEADELLQSSFKATIEDIFNVLPKDKQVIATSATYPPKMKKLLYNYLVEPHVVSLSAKKLALLGIVHYAKVVPYSLMPIMSYRYKLEALENILRKLRYSQCLIFCNGLAKVELLCRDIKKWGFSTTFISSAKDQVDRLKAIDRLKEFKCKILVSSDVAARGIDAENVDLVVNFELPQCTETYLHRAGRAGRYGSHGVTINLVNDKEIKNLEDRESDGGFKSYKLPDPLPSDLIRNPVLGEYLIEDIKLDSPASDTNICEDKEANPSNGEDASEALPDVVVCKANTRFEEDSSASDTNICEDKETNPSNGKDDAGEALPDAVVCKENTRFEEDSSASDTNICEDKETNPSNGKDDAGEARPDAVVCKENTRFEDQSNEKQFSSSNTDIENCAAKQNLNCGVESSLERVYNVLLEGNASVKMIPLKHELTSSKINTHNSTSEKYPKDNTTNVSEYLSEVPLIEPSEKVDRSVELRCSKVDGKIESVTSEICHQNVVNISKVVLMGAKENSIKRELITDNTNINDTIPGMCGRVTFTLSNVPRRVPEVVTEIQAHCIDTIKNPGILNCLNFSEMEKKCIQDALSEDVYVNLSNTDQLMNLTVLSPEAILKAKFENQSDQEISSEQENENSDINDDEIIIKMIDSLKEGKFCGDLLTEMASCGKFASYEAYDLCFKIKSFLQEYEKNKKNGVSASERKGDSNSVKHVGNDNISAEMVKDLMSNKSEYYYQVFKTYLQECMVTNDNEADKSDNLFIKNNETEKHDFYTENEIEQKTDSKEFERTLPKLLDENSDNNHVVDSSNQVKNNGDVIVKFNVPKLAGTSGIGKILFYRPNYEDSDSDAPALMSFDKEEPNTTSDSISESCDSVSSSLSCNEGIHQKKRYERKESDSNPDSEFCTDSHSKTSSHVGNFHSEGRDFNDLHERDSSSDSDSSDLDSSSHKRNRQSKKKCLDSSYNSDSSSDSEYSSDSSYSDSSSCKKNAQSKKRDLDNLHETDSGSDSESSSLSSDTDSSCSHIRKSHPRCKVGNFRNPNNTFNAEQNIPCTGFASTAKNSRSDYSKFVPSFVETPYQQYNYNCCQNVCTSRQSSTKNSVNTEKIKAGKSQGCIQCAKYQPTHYCMKNVHHQPHSNLYKGCIYGKSHNSSEVSTNYCSRMHSHAGSCYMPSSHRCHPVLPNFSCSSQMCEQWYNTFYTQWMCIRRHANLPF